MTMRKITINVTEQDIKNGIRAAINACPIARAFSRHVLPEEDWYCGLVLVGEQSHSKVVVPNPGSKPTVFFNRDGKADEFIQAFDNVRPVEPTSIEYETAEA